MKQTNNLGLALYESTDKFNITGSENSLNHNMELLDEAITNPPLKISALSQLFSSCEETSDDYISASNTYLKTTEKVNWLYGLYDSLVSAYPEYVTRTKIAETDEPSICYSSNTPVHTANYMPDISEFEKGLLRKDGTVIDSTNYYTSPIFTVPSGKKFTVQNEANGNVIIRGIRTFVAYDVDGNVISEASVENLSDGAIVDIPEKATQIRVCISVSYYNYVTDGTWRLMFVVNGDGSVLAEYVENSVALPERTDLISGIPMYRYDFKPPISTQTKNVVNTVGKNIELPKILYTGGIHGGEYFQVISAYRFFKMLCDKWQKYELLSDLRWNVHFVVIPLTNPFGFQYPSRRYNANGVSVSKLNEHNVDISGNFPSDNYQSGDNSKYGTVALSEPESIALYNIIQNENFILSIDNHTYGYLASEYNGEHMASYFIANHAKHPQSTKFWFKIGRWLNLRVRKLSPDIMNTSYANNDLSQLWLDTKDQMLNNTFKSVGANIEMPISIDPVSTTLQDPSKGIPPMEAETQTYMVDLLATTFYEALQDFYTY